MEDQELPTFNGIGTSNSQLNQDTSQSNANLNQGTSTSKTDNSQDTPHLKDKADQDTTTPKPQESKDTSESHAKADQGTSTPSNEESQDTSQAKADQDTSPSSNKGSRDTSQANAKADQELPTFNGIGTSNSQLNQDNSTPKNEGSQDTSQSKAKVDQDTSTPNKEGIQDTSQAKANQDTSTPSNKGSQGTTQSNAKADNYKKNQGPLINTMLSSWSYAMSLFTVLYRDAAKVVLTKEGFNALAAFLVGCEASRSKQAFCLVLFSFLGGSEYGQRVPILTILYFLGGFGVGVGVATVYVVLLFCFIAYACELNTRDAVIVGFTFLFGLLCNVSDQAFFLVVYSYLGGQIVRCDKEALVYLGPCFLIGITGAFDFLTIPFSLRF